MYPKTSVWFVIFCFYIYKILSNIKKKNQNIKFVWSHHCSGCHFVRIVHFYFRSTQCSFLWRMMKSTHQCLGCRFVFCSTRCSFLWEETEKNQRYLLLLFAVQKKKKHKHMNYTPFERFKKFWVTPSNNLGTALYKTVDASTNVWILRQTFVEKTVMAFIFRIFQSTRQTSATRVWETDISNKK